jgi:3-hydroxyacyl-CoA dehydrogenase
MGNESLCLKIGIIGAGTMGQDIAEVILSRTDLTTDPASLRECEGAAGD